MRFPRHDGIYRSDVSSHLVNLGRSTAFRSGPGQALERAGSKHALPIVTMSSGRLFLNGLLASIAPSLLHRQNQIKSIAASKGIIYHRTVNSLLTGCLTERDKFNKPRRDFAR